MQSSPAPASWDAPSLCFTMVWFRRVMWWEKRGSRWGRQTEGSVLGLRNTAAAQLRFTDAATGTGPVLQTLISLRVTAQQSVHSPLLCSEMGCWPPQAGVPMSADSAWLQWLKPLKMGIGKKGRGHSISASASLPCIMKASYGRNISARTSTFARQAHLWKF